MRAAGVFLAFTLLATCCTALLRGSRHFFGESSWSDHAYHHLARQIVLDCGVSVRGLLLLHHFLWRRRERWAWWGWVVVGLTISGGYWLSSWMLGLGEPARLPYLARAAYTLTYAVGLLLCWRLRSKAESTS